jgi:hypothetical protein
MKYLSKYSQYNRYDERLLTNGKLVKLLQIFNREKINHRIKDFLLKCKEEAGDYKRSGKILKKYAKGEKLTTEEIKEVREQLIDTLKIGGSGIILALPFGSVLLFALIKTGQKFNINFLPSAWNKNEVKY